MARERNPNRDKAFEIYKEHKGDIDLVEIASQLGTPDGTIRGWKSKDKWDKKLGLERNGTERKKERNVPQKKKNATKPIADEVKQVMDNPELTDKQRLFCLNYIKCFNATKAYQKAYGVDYNTAASIAYRLMDNDGIKTEIKRLKQGKLNQSFLEPGDIFQKYMDIAFSDITDYVEFGREEVPVMGPFGPIEIKDEDTGKNTTLTKVVNTVRFKESGEVDGTIIGEVKQGKDGATIKLYDQMKALQWLTDHMDMATERQRLEMARMKIEVSQLSGGNEGDTGIKDFLKAIKPTEEDMKELFADEEVIEDGEEITEE